MAKKKKIILKAKKPKQVIEQEKTNDIGFKTLVGGTLVTVSLLCFAAVKSVEGPKIDLSRQVVITEQVKPGPLAEVLPEAVVVPEPVKPEEPAPVVVETLPPPEEVKPVEPEVIVPEPVPEAQVPVVEVLVEPQAPPVVETAKEEIPKPVITLPNKKVVVKKPVVPKPQKVVKPTVNDSLKARCDRKKSRQVRDRIERKLNNCVN